MSKQIHRTPEQNRHITDFTSSFPKIRATIQNLDADESDDMIRAPMYVSSEEVGRLPSGTVIATYRLESITIVRVTRDEERVLERKP